MKKVGKADMANNLHNPFIKCMIKIIGGGVVFVALLLTAAFFIFSSDRLSRYHTYGEILVTVDGKPYVIDGISVTMFYNTPKDGDTYKSTVIRDNKFRISKGVYGLNTYSFTLPPSVWGGDPGDEGILVEVADFNGAWYTVFDLAVNVDIITVPSLKASMSGCFTDKNFPNVSREFFISEKAITATDNTIYIRTASP